VLSNHQIEADSDQPGVVDLSTAEVVVVSSSMHQEQKEKALWIWPESFTKVEQEQGARILNSLAKTGQLDDAQNIIDELTGWMATGGVKSNLSYLRRLVETHQKTPGGLVYERGPDVRLRRERLAVVTNRMQLSAAAMASTGPTAGPGDRIEGEGAVEPVVLTDAAKSGLAKARELLANIKKGST
jgi:hypothetical protein